MTNRIFIEPLRAMALALLLAALPAAGMAQDADSETPMTMEEIEAAYHAGDFEAAREGLLPFAESGDVTAQYRLGHMMANSSGGPFDREGAIVWLEKAAAQGHKEAPVLLARTYLSGRPEAPEFDRAAELFTAAAAEGDAEAKFYLAQLKRRGVGAARDPEGGDAASGRRPPLRAALARGRDAVPAHGRLACRHRQAHRVLDEGHVAAVLGGPQPVDRRYRP